MNAFARNEIAILGSGYGVVQRHPLPVRTALQFLYEPIITLATGRPAGYQASMPTMTSVGGYTLCRMQLEHCPPSDLLLLNLSPDALLGREAGLLPLLAEHVWEDHELVVNIVHQDKGHARDSRLAYQRLQQAGIAIALEDTAVLEINNLAAFLDARLLKINVSTLETPARKRSTPLECMLDVARKVGIQTLLAGVETKEHLDWAKKLDVDLVQGAYFRM